MTKRTIPSDDVYTYHKQALDMLSKDHPHYDEVRKHLLAQIQDELADNITEDQITEQVNLERSQIKQGLKRLRDQTYKLEAQQYSSATVYGIASIDALLPRVVQRIEDTNKKIHQGKYGAAFKDIHQYLASIEALAAAAIA